MSDSIAPIQRDAVGNTTFEKVQTVEVSVPDTSAAAQSAASKGPATCGSDDGLNFSRPMKKFLVKKSSFFTAPPPPSDIQKQQRRDEQTPGSKFQHEA